MPCVCGCDCRESPPEPSTNDAPTASEEKREQRDAERRRRRSRRGRVAAAAFGLNAAWEVGHWRLYACPLRPIVLVGAACVDTAVTLGAAEAASVATRRAEHRFLPTLVTGLALAAWAIELQAIWRERRFYRSSMPTVGGVGIAPLVQLPLLGAVAVALADRREPTRR